MRARSASPSDRREKVASTPSSAPRNVSGQPAKETSSLSRAQAASAIRSSCVTSLVHMASPRLGDAPDLAGADGHAAVGAVESRRKTGARPQVHDAVRPAPRARRAPARRRGPPRVRGSRSPARRRARACSSSRARPDRASWPAVRGSTGTLDVYHATAGRGARDGPRRRAVGARMARRLEKP